MHLNIYIKNNLELYLYSKYFIYSELLKSTQTFGAYLNHKLVGVLLVKMKNSPNKVHSLWYKLYVSVVKLIMKVGYKNTSDIYDGINKKC